MRINKIRINGFKSFVDSTAISLPGNLTGIVGPNGCGKSNIIDALTWVLGETSAKQLRGDSMDDIIFNGSSGRPPVSRASVEIILDNADGMIGDRYSKYSEISVKRELIRETPSIYTINGVRCRRKDVTDLFLGTGVGSRQYSVIGQGMVSRIVESKPEEMRGFLEEAAGISRYKDRRRETENKIRQARTNISRINDLRGELQTQLNRLERQAREAKRYNKLKEEEAHLQKKVLVYRWSDLERKRKRLSVNKITTDEDLRVTNEKINKFDSNISAKTTIAEEKSKALGEAQAEFYKFSAEISRIEEVIKQNELRKADAISERTDVKEKIQTVRQDLIDSKSDVVTLGAEMKEVGELTAEAKKAIGQDKEILSSMLQQGKTSGEKLETVIESCQEHEKDKERLKLQLTYCQENLNSSKYTLASLAAEMGELERNKEEHTLGRAKKAADEENEQRNTLKAKRDNLRGSILGQRIKIEEKTRSLHQIQKTLEEERGRYSSLKTLQDSVHGKESRGLITWFKDLKMDSLQRLVETIEIEPGWEVAFEKALSIPLSAYVKPDVIADLTMKFDRLGNIPTDVTFVDGKEFETTKPNSSKTILTKIQKAPSVVKEMAARVLIAESREELAALKKSVTIGTVAVSKDGTLIGPGWMSISDQKNEKTNLLLRETEINRLKSNIEGLESKIEKTQAFLNGLNENLSQLHIEEQGIENDIQLKEQQAINAKETYLEEKAKNTQKNERITTIKDETLKLRGLLEKENEIEASLIKKQKAVESNLQEFYKEKLEFTERHKIIENQTETARNGLLNKTAHLHSLEIKIQSFKSRKEAIELSILQNHEIENDLLERTKKISALLDVDEVSKKSEVDKIDLAFRKKIDLEEQIRQIKNVISGVEEENRELNKRRKETLADLEATKAKKEEIKIEDRSLEVVQEEIIKAAHKNSIEIESAKNEIADGDTESSLEEEREKVLSKIERLGPLNLAAIEEFTQLEVRKNHLDHQNEDLEKALGNLATAIKKIDNETKARFKEIYDKVNENMTTVFQKLFGGGSARLVLTEEDLLETGVSVIARPPGKRNTNISQLSGGEKALTALSIIFTIFSLKPSPFCLLDEVDAPLDDSNVIRYAELIAEMAKSVQFLFVSHNKLTMEIADQLIGITMEEPGISRTVSVDMSQALKLVESG